MNNTRDQEISRALFRDSNDALFIFDPQSHQLVDVNPVALRITGLGRKVILEMRVWDLFSSEVDTAIHELVSAYVKTGFFHSREDYLLRVQGLNPVPVNLSVSRIHTRPDPLGLVVARDVSERRRADDALRASEDRYRRLVETACLMIWSISASGTLIAVNPAFEAALGRTAADCIGSQILEFCHEDDRTQATQALEAARRGDQLSSTVLRLIRTDGTIRYIELLSVQEIDGGSGAFVACISQDLTMQKLAEEATRQVHEFKAAKEVAEAANRSKNLFLAHLSHEVRTPMTAILGITELLLEDVERIDTAPEAWPGQLGEIRQNGQYLLELIDDLLDLSKVEMGKLRIRQELCIPSQIAAQVIESLRPRAVERALHIFLDVATYGAVTMLSDPVRIRQILINLLSNAIRYTDQGEIRIRLSTKEDNADPWFVIEVIDTGIGMSETQLARLFEPFSRQEEEPTHHRPGTGLGLSITKRLVEALDGHLRISSTVGLGSKFSVELPIVKHPIEHPNGCSPGSTRAGAVSGENDKTVSIVQDQIKARILVAEDNTSYRNALTLRLQRWGAEVTSAENGKEVLERTIEAEQHGQPFDVILMDMQMPLLDGYEATRRIRAIDIQTPIIALTAYAMAEDRNECLEIGCNDYASKPVEWHELCGLIIKHLAVECHQDQNCRISARVGD